MKIRLPYFHYLRQVIPLHDTPYLYTKITFTSFEYHVSKCFKSFTNIST
ncbi:hypothetical protein PMI29_00963 [Pseudomonas sp. GM49]|nr:hypothetical protein PMI29_00963 [Pseudomonas sp. GM49]